MQEQNEARGFTVRQIEGELKRLRRKQNSRRIFRQTVFSLLGVAAVAVLAAMLHTSRTRAAEYIAAGRVEINHLPLKAAHETAYAEDIFTVRGVGRFKLAAIGGKSRKDRLFISFYQY